MTGPDESSELPLSAAHNVAEYSVGEVARAIKRTLEGEFGRLRIRGEVSRPNYHGSGHLYFTLKDDEAVIDSVCWRGTVGKLSLRLEEGMEVICTGRISSYARSSKYQIVVDSVELAGEGALLKLLEDRRKKLAAEGLFDAERKKDIPFLPEIIGVVTSPTGAVIRDILHRVSDRFPRPVLLWPVPVQGDGAAEKIAAAIAGFNALGPGGAVPRPDTLIVARGGGSLEDLWCFNEEVVVRAVAESEIPVISAVGHETDTTLIDFAADLRAPTPTAAAEMAVPVRAELSAQILDCARRSVSAMERFQQDRRLRIDGLERGLPRPEALLAEAQQRLDGESDRLVLAAATLRGRLSERVAALAARIRHPRDVLALSEERLARLGGQLVTGGRAILRDRRQRLDGLDAGRRMGAGVDRMLSNAGARISGYEKLLESYSYKNVLKRGYSLVRDAAGQPVKLAEKLTAGDAVSIEFADGEKPATIGDGGAGPKPGKKARKKSPGRKKPDPGSDQGTLL